MKLQFSSVRIVIIFSFLLFMAAGCGESKEGGEQEGEKETEIPAVEKVEEARGTGGGVKPKIQYVNDDGKVLAPEREKELLGQIISWRIHVYNEHETQPFIVKPLNRKEYQEATMIDLPFDRKLRLVLEARSYDDVLLFDGEDVFIYYVGKITPIDLKLFFRPEGSGILEAGQSSKKSRGGEHIITEKRIDTSAPEILFLDYWSGYAEDGSRDVAAYSSVTEAAGLTPYEVIKYRSTWKEGWKIFVHGEFRNNLPLFQVKAKDPDTLSGELYLQFQFRRLEEDKVVDNPVWRTRQPVGIDSRGHADFEIEMNDDVMGDRIAKSPSLSSWQFVLSVCDSSENCSEEKKYDFSVKLLPPSLNVVSDESFDQLQKADALNWEEDTELFLSTVVEEGEAPARGHASGTYVLLRSLLLENSTPAPMLLSLESPLRNLTCDAHFQGAEKRFFHSPPLFVLYHRERQKKVNGKWTSTSRERAGTFPSTDLNDLLFAIEPGSRPLTPDERVLLRLSIAARKEDFLTQHRATLQSLNLKKGTRVSWEFVLQSLFAAKVGEFMTDSELVFKAQWVPLEKLATLQRQKRLLYFNLK